MREPLEVRVFLAPQDRRSALEQDVRRGFSSTQKFLPPTWFYDERGSELFEEITTLAEYYPTRVETEILAENAPEIASLAEAEVLVELGSGSSTKTRLLLDAMTANSGLSQFVPFDVSESALIEAAEAVSREYDLDVTAIVGDFSRHLAEIPDARGPRLFAFLGSTIGNLDPRQRRRFFFDLEAQMSHEDCLLIGVDLLKDRSKLLAAYDDDSGVTAEFNRNVLTVLNNELGADFDVPHFKHVAHWNEPEKRIEMRLRATSAQRVTFSALRWSVAFAEGEELLTEICTKFSLGDIRAELEAANFVVTKSWGNPGADFLLTLAHPYC